MDLDKEAVLQALRAADGNVGEAAKALNVSRRTLQNRMREYQLARSKGGRPKFKLKHRRQARRAAGGLGIMAAVAGALLVGSKLGGGRRGGGSNV